MADAADDARKAMEEQIAELRGQIDTMSKSLKERGEEAAEEARTKLHRATSTIKEQGQATVSAIRENPGTATTILSSAGIAGFVLGFLVASCWNDNR
ncbi:hypothetical protein [Pseudochrobactrum sp. MP213Fo]|uniref:hypothetical protein n=1 Tax=Pseudochrobactrum sp. MP213Fo TaxID=3022250 RepID=UPI003BA10388